MDETQTARYREAAVAFIAAEEAAQQAIEAMEAAGAIANELPTKLPGHYMLAAFKASLRIRGHL